MRRRRGRRRKIGRRHPNGALVRPALPSPREIAAGMPHRRGLGEQASDPMAATELGRLALLNVLTPEQHLAGETFLGQWHAYLSTLAGPSAGSGAQGRGFDCTTVCGDPERRRACRCAFLRAIWTETIYRLHDCGLEPFLIARRVVLHDERCASEDLLYLCHGLDALAHHFGLLTGGQKRNYVNALSLNAPAPP